MDDHRTAQARHWLDVGRPERCLDALEQVDPEGPGVAELRARALLGLNRWDEAADVARRGLGVDPDDLNLYLVLAGACNGLHRPLDAEMALAAALRRAPDDVVLLTIFAEQITSTLHFDRADAVLSRAAQIDPHSIDVDVARAHWCSATGDRHGAQRWLDRALEKDPEDARALYLAGQLATRSGRTAEGTVRLRRAALQHLESDRLVAAARGAGRLQRRPCSWFMPALRLPRVVVGVAALMSVLVGSALVRAGNPVVGWTILVPGCSIALYTAIGWMLLLVVMD